MNALAEPPDRWDADTAKPGVGSTGLAAIPGVGVVNIADWGRHETSSNSLKDGCRARKSRATALTAL
jgi:hypothetical protein